MEINVVEVKFVVKMYLSVIEWVLVYWNIVLLEQYDEIQIELSCVDKQEVLYSEVDCKFGCMFDMLLDIIVEEKMLFV